MSIKCLLIFLNNYYSLEMVVALTLCLQIVTQMINWVIIYKERRLSFPMNHFLRPNIILWGKQNTLNHGLY